MASNPARIQTSTKALAAIASLLAAVLAAVIPGTARADSGNPPTLVDSFGGPLHYEMYPSGLETTSDGGVVIADTGNNQVAKYAGDGTQVWRVGSWGADLGEFDNPRDVAVDSNDNVYVVDTRNSRVVKLGADGSWQGTYTGVTGDTVNYPMGATISDDLLYLADTGRKKVRVLDVNDNWNTVRTVVPDPDGGLYPDSGCRNLKGIRDADADSAGNVYVTGYLTNDIAKFDVNGDCVDWGVTGTGPGQFRTPYGVRVAYDPIYGQDVIHVADGLNARVQVFTLTGTYLTEYGTFGEPTEPGKVTTMRRVAVATDGSGDGWIADLWGYRIERYDRGAGGFTYAETIGTPPPPSTDTALFHEPRGIAVGPDGVVNITDTVHHRFVRMDSTGHVLDICGSRAVEGAALGEYNWPRGLAVDNVTGEIWVADTKQNRIQVVEPDCTGLLYLGDFYPGASDIAFDWPYGVAIRQSDRIAFVADTENNRIKAYDVASRNLLGKYGQLGSGFSQMKNPRGIAVSPVSGNIFLADTLNNRIKEISSTNGTTFTTVRNITKDFNRPESVAVDSQGRIYVADSGDNEIVILDANRNQIAELDTGLAHPQSVAVDASGRVYVSDTYNDRVLVYEWPPPDTVAPNGTASVPSNNQSFALGTVPMSGSATDNVGVSSVSVAIKNTATNQWWTGSTWGAYKKLAATLATPGGTSTTWTYNWPAPSAGTYAVSVIAEDAAGNVDPTRPWVNFTVTTSADTVRPDGTITSPGNNTTIPAGSWTYTGNATDNVGVTSVDVMIKNRANNTFWNGSAWVGTFTWRQAAATLGTPGGTSTSWTYVQILPAGIYAVSVRARDAAGNYDQPQPWVNFTVS